MPNTPKTPLRSVRIDDSLWFSAVEKAAEEGRSVSEVIRTKLAEYVGAEPEQP